MTVEGFQVWAPPAELQDRRWQLVDGEPVCMAPPSSDHAAIHSEAVYLLTGHLRARRPDCRVLVTPGVVPAIQATTNERVPDIGVTCSPARNARTVPDPVLLIEILSPSNEAQTRANVWAYCSVASVQEVLLLSSTSLRAELLRRDTEGRWPAEAAVINSDDRLLLGSIEFDVPLRAFYRTTSLLPEAMRPGLDENGPGSAA